MKFDPMTGKPIAPENNPPKIVGYDPMTGEPIYEKVQAAPQPKIVGYDPMTGAPIYDNGQNPSGASSNISNQNMANQGGGPAMQTPKKPFFKTGGGIALICVLAVLVIVAIGGGVVFAVTNMNSHNKLLVATINTLKDDTVLSNVVNMYEVANGQKLTMEVDVTVEEDSEYAKMEGVISADVPAMKYYVDGTANISGIQSQKVQAYLDHDKVQVLLPSIYGDVFQYQFTGENNGYLKTLLEDEVGYGVLDAIDESVQATLEMTTKSSEYQKVLLANLNDAYKNVEIEKIDKRKFEIDDKDRKCAGYKVVLTTGNLIEFVDALEEANEECYGEAQDALMDTFVKYDLIDEDEEIDDVYNELRSSLYSVGNGYIEFCVYIYKNQLAAITYGGYDGYMEVLFEGGHSRAANMRIVVDGESLVRESNYKNGVEDGRIYVPSEEGYISYSYDTKTGEYEITYYDGYDVYGMEGIFKSKGNFIEFAVDGDIDGVTIDWSFIVSKGARIQSIEGDIFDVGTATESDFYRVAEDIANKFGY